MPKEQKMKALHFLEMPDTPNPDRQTDRQTAPHVRTFETRVRSFYTQNFLFEQDST